MFGVAVASLQRLDEAERERYQALYCGLCLALKQEFGQVSRAALSYDLAFLVMLYDSLYEPDERQGRTRCITHPRKKVPYAIGEFDRYCAALSVALAYHKCLDDVADDDSKKARIAQAALRGPYEKAAAAFPEQCAVIEGAMAAIAAIERDAHAAPDAASAAFGDMLGFLFECVPGRFPDLWSTQLRDLGFWLGRFVYLMDAAVDFRQDARSGSYNPFVRLSPEPDPQAMRDVLGCLAARACEAFERLPLVQDANIMRSVLYSGIWQKFNAEYRA